MFNTIMYFILYIGFKNYSKTGAPGSNWTSDHWLWRQMLYYILVSSVEISIRVENQYDDFVKVMQNSMACFHLFRFYIHFIWKP